MARAKANRALSILCLAAKGALTIDASATAAAQAAVSSVKSIAHAGAGACTLLNAAVHGSIAEAGSITGGGGDASLEGSDGGGGASLEGCNGGGGASLGGGGASLEGSATAVVTSCRCRGAP